MIQKVLFAMGCSAIAIGSMGCNQPVSLQVSSPRIIEAVEVCAHVYDSTLYHEDYSFQHVSISASVVNTDKGLKFDNAVGVSLDSNGRTRSCLIFPLGPVAGSENASLDNPRIEVTDDYGNTTGPVEISSRIISNPIGFNYALHLDLGFDMSELAMGPSKLKRHFIKQRVKDLVVEKFFASREDLQGPKQVSSDLPATQNATHRSQEANVAL